MLSEKVFKVAKSGVGFIKKYPGIISSLVLIVLVPLALYFNLRIAVDSFKQRVDLLTQREAFLIEKVLSEFIIDYSDFSVLKAKLESISINNPDIAYIEISTKEGEEFKSLIQVKKNGEGLSDKDKRSFMNVGALAWQNNEAMGFLSDEREWHVVKPIYNKNSEKIGMIWMALSLKNSDAVFARAERNSYIILALAIILILLLLINHTRLYEQAVSFTKLKEVDKVKDEFISTAAHELKTPVAVIKGYAQILKEDTRTGKSTVQKNEERLDKIITTSNNLADLITDILDVSRIEQGRMAFEMQTISPQAIIKDVVDIMRVKAAEKNLSIIYENKEDSYNISVDPARLKQIMINLMSNAIKYTPKGSVEVAIQIKESEKKYIITVKDTGIGMSAQEQKNLFTKFYRIKNQLTDSIQGTGLGLWITKTICERMGGEILMESMEGVGSKFTVTFPLIS